MLSLRSLFHSNLHLSVSSFQSVHHAAEARTSGMELPSGTRVLTAGWSSIQMNMRKVASAIFSTETGKVKPTAIPVEKPIW